MSWRGFFWKELNRICRWVRRGGQCLLYWEGDGARGLIGGDGRNRRIGHGRELAGLLLLRLLLLSF